MKENVIRKVFSAIAWPPKASAFQKLIDFIVEGLSSKAETSKLSELENKLSELESSISTKADSSAVEALTSQLASKANQSDLASLTSRVEALEGAQE